MAQITTSEFATALDTDTRTVRKFLRSITPKDEQPGKGARWAIDGNKRSLTTMKKNFDAWTAEVEARKAEAQTETEEPALEVDDEALLDD